MYKYADSDKMITIAFSRYAIGVQINPNGGKTTLCFRKKGDPDLRVAMIRESRGVWSVVYQKRELSNRRGLVSMQKAWKRYQSI
jgi:hypothetical protein